MKLNTTFKLKKLVQKRVSKPLGGAATGVAHPPLGALARAEQTIPSLLDGAAWNSEDRGERTDKLGRRCGAAILRRLLSTKP